MKKNWLRTWREHALARAERKLDHIQSFIDGTNLGWRTVVQFNPAYRWLIFVRLNAVCRKIQRLDAALKSGK